MAFVPITNLSQTISNPSGIVYANGYWFMGSSNPGGIYVWKYLSGVLTFITYTDLDYKVSGLSWDGTHLHASYHYATSPYSRMQSYSFDGSTLTHFKSYSDAAFDHVNNTPISNSTHTWIYGSGLVGGVYKQRVLCLLNSNYSVSSSYTESLTSDGFYKSYAYKTWQIVTAKSASSAGRYCLSAFNPGPAISKITDTSAWTDFVNSIGGPVLQIIGSDADYIYAYSTWYPTGPYGGGFVPPVSSPVSGSYYISRLTFNGSTFSVVGTYTLQTPYGPTLDKITNISNIYVDSNYLYVSYIHNPLQQDWGHVPPYDGNSYWYYNTFQIYQNTGATFTPVQTIQEIRGPSPNVNPAVVSPILADNGLLLYYDANYGPYVYDELKGFILANPTNKTIYVYETATFTAGVTGATGTWEQWYKTPVSTGVTGLIAGATGVSYTTPNQGIGSNGDSYFLALTDGTLTAFSTPAVLTVGSALAIKTQPTSITKYYGETGMFSVGVTGYHVTEQWYKIPALTGITGAVAGATGLSYTTPPLVLSNSGDLYYVRISETGVNPKYSNLVSSTVLSSLAITKQPLDMVTLHGEAVTFSAGATGYHITEQWYKNDSGVTGPEAGATGMSLPITGPQLSDTNNKYWMQVSETGSNGVQTRLANLTVNSLIYQNPTYTTAYLGQPATFTVGATGAALVYQWHIRDTLSGVTGIISGATGPSYVIVNTAYTDNSKKFWVNVKNMSAGETSGEAGVLVSPVLEITVQPDFFAGRTGNWAVFNVSATGGAGPLTYQWYRNGILISGETGTSLVLGPLNTSNNGDYVYCIISDGYVAVQSEIAYIWLIPTTGVGCTGAYGSGRYAQSVYKVCGASGQQGTTMGMHEQALRKIYPIKGFDNV